MQSRIDPCRLLLVLACGLSGCVPKRAALRPIEGPSFGDVYERLSHEVRSPVSEADQAEPRMTIRSDETPLREFLATIARRTGASVVASSSIDSAEVSIDVFDQPVSVILGAVARRLGVEVSRAGGVYFLGPLKPEDRGVLVRRVRRLAGDELHGSVSALLSDHGRVVAYSDGLVIVADRVEVLSGVESMLSAVEAAPSVTWVVQLHLVSLTRTDVRDLGIDAVPALEVGATFAVASATGIPSGAPPSVLRTRAAGGLDAMLRAVRTRSESSIVAEPLLLLGDGETATVRRGRVLQIPQRTVSDQGTVTTNGFEQINTGLTVTCTVRELSESSARLATSVELSDVESFVEEAPVLAVQSLQGRADVKSGGVYLLGAVEVDEERSTVGELLQWGRTKEDGNRVLHVWARVYRVGSPIGENENGGRCDVSEVHEHRGAGLPLAVPEEVARVGEGTVLRSDVQEVRSGAASWETGVGGDPGTARSAVPSRG